MKDYIIKVLNWAIGKMPTEEKKKELQDAIVWLESNSDSQPGEELLEAQEFLERLKSSEPPVDSKEAEDFECEVAKIVEDLKIHVTRYRDILAKDDVQGCEILKQECNVTRQTLTILNHDINRAYRKVKNFADKVYLPREAAKINEKSGVNIKSAMETVKSYPEYVKLIELREQLFISHELTDRLFKDMDSLHTDIRQTSALLRKTIPEV